MSFNLAPESFNITTVAEVEIANILLFSSFFSDLSTFPFVLIFYKSPQKVAVRELCTQINNILLDQRSINIILSNKENFKEELPWLPKVKTPSFHLAGTRLVPGRRTEIPYALWRNGGVGERVLRRLIPSLASHLIHFSQYALPLPSFLNPFSGPYSLLTILLFWIILPEHRLVDACTYLYNTIFYFFFRTKPSELQYTQLGKSFPSLACS